MMKSTSFQHLKRQLSYIVCNICLLTLLSACGDSTQGPGNSPKLVTLASVTSATAAEPSGLEVVSLKKTNESRITRTVFEYTYLVSIRNNGSSAASNVVATLSKAPNGTQIMDGKVFVASINAGATATSSTDVIVLRQDRTIAFEPSALTWVVDGVSAGSSEIELEAVKPAEVVLLSLEDLGLSPDANKVTVTGAVSNVLIKDGVLRFSTPGDTGVDQEATLKVGAGNSTTELHVWIRTQRPTAIVSHLEPDEDETAPPAPPELVVTGLGPNNIVTGAPLTFKLSGVGQLDLNDNSKGFFIGAGNATVSLKQFWKFNPVDSSFSISGAALQQLLSVLPSGSMNLDLNFVSKDGKFAHAYELLASYKGATIAGKLLTSGGVAVPSLAGKKILLKGYNSNMRRTAVIDANGSFSFLGVIPDTYQLTLDDLEFPNIVSASTVIFPFTTQANVMLVYPTSLLGNALMTNNSAGAKANSFFISSSVVQNGKEPQVRNIAPSESGIVVPKIAGRVSAQATAPAVFSATAAAQNQTVTAPVNYVVPTGTQNVGVKVTVFTAEYPVFTTAQSQYNDTWSYTVLGLPGTVLSSSGSVNQTHFTQGTITKSLCVDVSEKSKTNPFNVTGAVSATNIGDSALPTITTVELSLECSSLHVASATMFSPNADGHPVIQPKTVPGNLESQYVSIQKTAPDATHTVPLEIIFKPSDATITDVNIGISFSGGEPIFASENLMQQAHVSTAGKIRFPKLSLPPFSGGSSNGKVKFTVQVKGTINGISAASNPAEEGQVAFEGITEFTPLYLAGDVTSLAGRRYGSRDLGGDSWATKKTIDWLDTKSYRFDDISAMHVTQTPQGRSILCSAPPNVVCHKGHSDGQQLDLRYADGQGGYTDALGGQGKGKEIKKLIDAAEAENASNSPTKPKLALLRSWIAQNRAMLEAEAASANTRKIFIGPDFIERALIQGRFNNPPYDRIPLVDEWDVPNKVQTDASHMSHWHISLTAHP